MHLLPCPNCQASIAVSPSQAGDEAICPQCQSTVAIPKLGLLRQLPLEEPNRNPLPTAGEQSIEISTARRAAFVVLGLIAMASLLVAGFCGIRWSLVEVRATTDEHIAVVRQEYEKLTAAELIREYEQMERQTLDLAGPYKYKTDELKRRKWGLNASIAAAIGGGAFLGAFILALTGRPSAAGRQRELPAKD